MKIKTRNLGLSAVLVMLFIGIIGIANAQEALPKGGDSFETAIEIKPGIYQRDTLEENEYFYVVDIKPGQEINIKYTFGAGTGNDGWGTLGLYDEDKTKLFDEWDTVNKGESKSITVSWLPNADKDSYKYYIKTGYDSYDVGPVSFDISLTNRYDAGSQKDVGDTFEKAMKITLGNYTGYLSGKKGTDTKDFYKLAVKKGETLTVKVTPPSEATMEVVVYDSNRKILKHAYASNPGAIVTKSVPIAKSGDVFVAVICGKYCSKNLVAYTLNIETKKDVAVEEEEVEALPEEEVPVEEMYPGIYPEEEKEAAKTVEKGFRWALIMGIVGIVVVIIIIVLVVYFLARKKKK